MAMPHKLWTEIAGIVVLLHLVSPLLLRVTFRFSGRCNPVLVDPGAVAPLVQGLVGRCAPKFASLGFSFLGYFDVGSLATNTRSYLAYFVNRSSGVSPTFLWSPAQQKRRAILSFPLALATGSAWT
jgi:hypothetical protein